MNIDELRIIPVLKALTDEQLHFLLKSSHEKTCKKREIIFDPEEVNNYVIMLLQGRVRIYLAYPDGREFTIAFLEPGDVYSSHSGTFAEAMDHSRILFIETATFFRFMLNNPAILITMVQVLGESLGNTIHIIENLAFLDVDKRLACFLLEAAHHKGTPSDDGTLINLGLTVEEIASAVGSSRQTASMLLNRWDKEGIIKHNRKSLLLLDMDKLNTLAGKVDYKTKMPKK